MNWLIHPIETLKAWSVKKFVLGIVNGAIEKYNGNIATARAFVSKYVFRIEALLTFLKSLDGKLADGKITEDEAEDLVAEAKKLGEEIVA